MSIRTASSVASTLPPCRVLLLGAGVLLLSESMLLATTLFVAAALTFVISFALAASIYRASARERALRQERESSADGRSRAGCDPPTAVVETPASADRGGEGQRQRAQRARGVWPRRHQDGLSSRARVLAAPTAR